MQEPDLEYCNFPNFLDSQIFRTPFKIAQIIIFHAPKFSDILGIKLNIHKF